MLKPATRQLPRPTLRVVGGACHDGGGSMPQPRAAGSSPSRSSGQPNVGKSTVFNMLTGLSQHVGNWPGKTVEQKTGTFQHDGVTLDLVDLPGTYSLTANSEEERIARDYLIREQPDAGDRGRQRGRAGAQPLPGGRAAGAATCRWWSG